MDSPNSIFNSLVSALVFSSTSPNPEKFCFVLVVYESIAFLKLRTHNIKEKKMSFKHD